MNAIARIDSALKNDDPVDAYDLADKALEHPDTPDADRLELRRLRALALCRCGAIDSAIDDLTDLLVDHQDARTLTFHARALTDVAIASGLQADWRRALEQFLAAEATDPQAWSGVNVAFTQLMAGDHADARASAERQLKALPPVTDDSPWTVASHTELLLLLGAFDQARDTYQTLLHHPATGIEQFRTLNRRFPLIASQVGLTMDELHRLVPPPAVTVCDADGQPDTAIATGLARLDNLGRWLIGYTTLSSDTECTFAEHVLAHGGTVRVVAPTDFERMELERYSTAASRAANITRTDRVDCIALGNAPHPSIATDRAFAQSCALGLARLAAQGYGGRPIEQTTGSHSFLADLASDQHVIGTMLFADIKGFSKLDDTGINRFMTRVMASTRPLVVEGPDRPFAYQSWGDAIYGNFTNCGTGARFALALRDHLGGLDLPALDLPDTLGMRIALHAGPVTVLQDPLGDRQYFTGTHVCRTARMEPITPPGNVYVSEPFAALLAAEDQANATVRATFVGKCSLAKDFGDYAVYRLDHGTAATRRS